MAKRFTSTDKWTQNKWFRKLATKHKLFWLYLLDTCDNVGVWEEDIELASYLISEPLDKSETLKIFKEQIKVINNGKKWWIRKFCDYQYGVLDENNTRNKPRQSFIKTLMRHRLWADYKKSIGDYKGSDNKGFEKKLTSIQIVVEHYKKIKKYDTLPNWDKEHFARASASAKRILSQIDNEAQACDAITKSGSYHDNAGLSWTIETIVKKIPDWKLGKLKPKERKSQQSKQDKNIEGFADFAKEKDDAKKIV